MTTKQLPASVGDDNIDALAQRLQVISLADTMEAHPKYSVLDHALWLHVAATSRTLMPRVGARPTFPALELGLTARTRANTQAVRRTAQMLHGKATSTYNPCVYTREALQAQLKQEAKMRGVCKDDVKRVLSMELVYK